MTSIRELGQRILDTRISRRQAIGLTLSAAGLAALEACGNTTPTPVPAKVELSKPVEAVKPVEKPNLDPAAVFEQQVAETMRSRQANPDSAPLADAVHDEARRRLGTPVAINKPTEASVATVPSKPTEAAPTSTVPAKPVAEATKPVVSLPATPNAEGTALAQRVAALEVKAPTATATEVPTKELSGTKIRVFGMPDKPQGEVEIVKGDFKKQTDVLNFLLADPGGLLVGADFVDTTAKGNPYGSNPGATELYKSEGSIRFWDPVTEVVYRWSSPAFDNIPEGGFRTWSMGEGRIVIPRDSANPDPAMKEFVIDLPYEQGNNYIVIVRGLYADGKQDSDRNRTAKVTKFKPGHAWSAMYQSKSRSNLEYVSEDQIMQQVATSHASGNNCGAEGCSKVTLVGLDTNTGKYEVLTQTMSRDEAQADWKNARKGWVKQAGN